MSAVSPITTPGAVIDEQSLADLRRGMDLDPGQRPRAHRDRARQQRHARLVQRVGDAMGQQRVDARPGRQDLHRPHTTRRGIAVARGVHVATQLFRDLCEHAEAGHADSVAPSIRRLRRPSPQGGPEQRQGAKNACET